MMVYQGADILARGPGVICAEKGSMLDEWRLLEVTRNFGGQFCPTKKLSDFYSLSRPISSFLFSR
jgi:hypothetical protein